MTDGRSKSSSTENEKAHGALVASGEVDVGAELTAGKDIHLDPEEALRLRWATSRRCFWVTTRSVLTNIPTQAQVGLALAATDVW